MGFVKDTLSHNGIPSSKRVFGFISLIYFLILLAVVTAYLMYKGTLEANIVIVLSFAGSAALVPTGLSSVEKFKKDGGVQ